MKPAQISWRRYLRDGFAPRLSRLGERLGLDWLVYNPLVIGQFRAHGAHNAPLVVPALLELFPDTRCVLDVGAGTGSFAAEFQHRGREAIALERSRTGRRLARRQGVDCRSFDLNAAPPGLVPERPDLVYCFELAEHLTPALGERLVVFLVSFQAPVVFSAAHVGQSGIGHINEQPPAYWVLRFAAHGFSEATERSRLLRERLRVAGASSWFHTNPVVLLPRGRDSLP